MSFQAPCRLMFDCQIRKPHFVAPQTDRKRFSRRVNSKEEPWLMTYPRAGKCLLHEWKESTNYKFNVCFMLNVHRSFRFSVRLQLLASSFSSCSQHFIPCLDITFSYCLDSSVDRNKSWEVLWNLWKNNMNRQFCAAAYESTSLALSCDLYSF